jgi:hypothetical protein
MIKKIGYFTLMLIVVAYVALSDFKGIKSAIKLLNTPDDGSVFLGVVMMILVLTTSVLGIVIVKEGIKKLKED